MQEVTEIICHSSGADRKTLIEEVERFLGKDHVEVSERAN